MAVRVGINGFGRIGRNIMRAAMGQKDVDFVAVNDLTNSKTLAHLLKYDSVLGIFHSEAKATEKGITVDGIEKNLIDEIQAGQFGCVPIAKDRSERGISVDQMTVPGRPKRSVSGTGEESDVPIARLGPILVEPALLDESHRSSKSATGANVMSKSFNPSDLSGRICASPSHRNNALGSLCAGAP